MTPERERRIAEHLAETRRHMLELAFELNDLVRFTVSAAREPAPGARPAKVYYPMDPVNEAIRQWHELDRRLGKLAARTASLRERLGVPPFDAEGPAALDPPPAPGDRAG